MDTQPVTAVANDATAPVETAEDAFTRLAAEEFGITDEEEQPAETEGEEPTGEEADDETEVEEEADDLPPIDAPVSWDADAKAKFAELPRELQETVTKREAERERFVQSKSQEAAQARQTAANQAQAELAEYDAQMAQRYQQLAAQLAPQAPDPSLLRISPEAFYAQEAEYRTKTAQQQELQQHAQALAQQAQARANQAQQAELAEQHKLIVEQFPEYADPTTGPELQRKLSAVAKRIGYTDELISQARATDIIAMNRVAEAFDKADKYDTLQSTKMAKVRAAKGLPKVAKPGVAVGNDQLRASRAATAIETARSSKDRNVQGAAFFDYLKNTGQI